MRWTEQRADVEPRPLQEFLAAHCVVDVISLVSCLARAPVVFFNDACREGILAHLRSGRTELGGLLTGRAYMAGDGLRDVLRPVVCVDDFLPSEHYQSSGVSLSMGAEVWNRAGERIDQRKAMVVGWYHSHPNLGVFFSGTDRRTQRAFFKEDYSVGLVVDPVRGDEAWFRGRDSEAVGRHSILSGVDYDHEDHEGPLRTYQCNGLIQD
jgi:proteasome lid subunit RPN8/RPN11